MSNGRNSSHSGLPDSEESKDIDLTHRKGGSTAPHLIRLLSRLLKRIQILVIFAAGMLGGSLRLASRLSRNMKRGTTIAALVAVAVLAGHGVSAQVAPPPSLKTVTIPQPDNIGDFINGTL